MKTYFIDNQVDEGCSPDIFNISIIFADSNDEEIKSKAIDNIKMIIDTDGHGWSNFKDAYSYLEYYSVDIVWFKKYIEKGNK